MQSTVRFYVFFPSRIFRTKLIVYRKKLRLLAETVGINKRCGDRRILIRLFLSSEYRVLRDDKKSNDVRLRKERGVKSGSEIYVSRLTREDLRFQNYLVYAVNMGAIETLSLVLPEESMFSSMEHKNAISAEEIVCIPILIF